MAVQVDAPGHDDPAADVEFGVGALAARGCRNESAVAPPKVTNGSIDPVARVEHGSPESFVSMRASFERASHRGGDLADHRGDRRERRIDNSAEVNGDDIVAAVEVAGMIDAGRRHVDLDRRR